MIEQNMMVFQADWKGQKTFRMLPVTDTCAFTEVLYDTENKVLALIGKNNIPKLQMIPKLDSNGMVKSFKTKDDKGKFVLAQSQERKEIVSYYEYYIEDVKDIEFFIKTFAINPKHPMISIIKPPIVGKPKKKKELKISK